MHKCAFEISRNCDPCLFLLVERATFPLENVSIYNYTILLTNFNKLSKVHAHFNFFSLKSDTAQTVPAVPVAPALVQPIHLIHKNKAYHGLYDSIGCKGVC